MSAEPQARPAAATLDPLSRRIAACAIWLVGYGLVWQFVWRPLATWVNGAVVASILLGTLPPARVRPFTAGVALLGLAAVIQFQVNFTLMAIVLAVSGLLALSDGAFDLRGRRSEPRA